MFTRQIEAEKTIPVRPALECGPGRTKQNHLKETDINLIVKKYQKTGMINFVNTKKAEYMDAQPIDFQEAMNTILEAQEMFAAMPADMRKKFDNDPGKFLEFTHNPENIEEMYDLGLANRPDPKPETPAEVETPISPPGEPAP